MTGFFVTSTGTEIGKTIVSELFVNGLLRTSSSVGYYKPVASGCKSSEWGYRSPDEVEMIQTTPLEPDDVHSTFRFDAPLSPDKAAEREDRSITIDPILDEYEALKQQYDHLIVEGIGGIAVPFSPTYDVSDLAADLGLPVVMVVASGLGTISHTRTAVNYVNQNNTGVSGILLTPHTGRDIETTNRDHLKEFYPDRSIRLVPEFDENTREQAVDLIHESFLE
ncbi:MAG: dethiobiotin synthase [bacterium]